MTKFKNMEIAAAVAKNPHIFVKKSLWGLKTKVYYQPSYAEVDSVRRFYTMSSGSAIKRFLDEYSEGKCSGKKKTITIEYDDNGNYCLEMCSSRDGEFVAVQLFRYSDLSYNPVSDIVMYEGDRAHVLKRAIEFGEIECCSGSADRFVAETQVGQV